MFSDIDREKQTILQHYMWISYNKKKYSLSELRGASSLNSESEFEKSTLKFCQAWVGGQQEFKINTSGSTGTPKEIILKREAMEASALKTIKALQLKPGGTALVCLDTKYIAGQMMLVRCLLNGMNIVAVEPGSNPLKDTNESFDFAALVPFQLETILELSPEKLRMVRSAIIGGAAVGNFLRKKIQNTSCALYATYGMTETISHVALQKLNGGKAQDYFEALEGIQLRLDERGCLCIRASHLGDEIITNDLVDLLDGKRFRWLGRIDNVINSGGVKIIPEKIESVLEKIFDVLNIKNRFFVAGLPDEKLGHHVGVICEGIFFDQTIQRQIMEKAAWHLSKYELPKEFKFIEKFEETATGKINRYSSSAKVST